MFRRVFVANRGEVAARVQRTCRAHGIEVVQAVSTADRAAGFPYVAEADEVVELGPGPAAKSYLDVAAVVQAAVQSRCSALHPGWGFLAEDPRFAALCRAHGVCFVGPDPAVMDLMGRKLTARRAARDAGLPIVPGCLRPLRDADEAAAMAEQLGWPVLLKADAGGGGRGIRRADDEESLRRGFVEAEREARSAFGHPELYLERCVVGGRHVEFQVLGDGRGGALHLGERDCSIQRRHQKLVEESPCPAMDAASRERYGELCTRAAARWRYAGAGTMEFLRADDGALVFLEMNTRLQVEHPVTEVRFDDLDLVAWQLRIAAGWELPDATALEPHGHAIEVRVNAEDPDADFAPSPGTITAFDVGGEGIRVDTHVAPGATIPPFYDSLLAKVVAHGRDREEARTRLVAALRSARVEGVATTIPLLVRILEHPDFVAGDYDTGWLERERAAGRL